MQKIVGLICLGFLLSFAPKGAGAYADINNSKARALIARLKATKIKPVKKTAAPLLNFSLSPEHPMQNQNVSVFIQPDNSFPGREVSVDLKLNGVESASLEKPARYLWVLPLGLLMESKSYSLEASVFIENIAENTEIRDAVKLLDTDINRLTNQINRERDPAKRKILQAQRAEKIALKTELVQQLKRFRKKLGVQNFAFELKANPTDPSLPKITSLSPVTGPLAGGTAVTVSGQNFSSPVEAKFQGIPAASVSVVNDTTIQLVTPNFSGVEGAKDLELRFATAQGIKNISATAAFFASDPPAIPVQNIKPVAIASGNQKVPFGSAVQLDGSESYDENGHAFSYRWTFLSVPSNSLIPVGSDLNPIAQPSFSPDVYGTYVVRLVVTETSTPDLFVSDPSLAIIQVFGAPMPSANPISVGQGLTSSTQIIANNPNEGHSQSFTIISPPQHGSATVSLAGIVSYTAGTAYIGNDSLTVKVTDQTGVFGTVVIPVTIFAVNQAPNPSASAITLDQGTTATSQVFANDPNAGDSFTYGISVAPQHGTAVVSAAGLVSFTADSSYSGVDSITVTVTDQHGLFGSIVIPVTINYINIAPAPTAAAIHVNQGAISTSQVSANDANLGQAVSFEITAAPAHGSATVNSLGLVSFTAVTNYAGNDSLQVTVTDAGGLSGSVIIPITIISTNIAPSATAPSISVYATETKTSQISVSDANSEQSHTYLITGVPTHGMVSVNATGLVSFTAEASYVGADAITVQVTDNGVPEMSDTVTIPVTVMENHAPSPTAPNMSVALGGTRTSQISPNDLDLGQSHIYQITVAPIHGTASVNASGLVTYTAESGYAGSDSLTVQVTDNGYPNMSGSVTIGINISTNVPPSPTAPAITIAVNGTKETLITSNDPEGPFPFSYTVTTPPTLGTVTVEKGIASYVAGPDAGSDSFVVQVADAANPPGIGSVTVPVTIVTGNLAPNPGSFVYQIRTASLPVNVALVGLGASDPDGSILDYRYDTGDGTTEFGFSPGPFTGVALHNYMAYGTYNGLYTVRDDLGTSSSIPFTVNVVPTDVPTAKFSIDKFSCSAPCTVTADATAATDAEGITDYRWLWGDNSAEESGSGASFITRSHTFTSAGSYRIRLRTRDMYIAQGEGYATVYVDVAPPGTGSPAHGDINISPAREVLVGTQVTLNGDRSFDPNPAGSIVAYNWNFNDYGTCPIGATAGCVASGETTTYTYPQATTYYPLLTVTNALGGSAVSIRGEIIGVLAGHAPRPIFTLNGQTFSSNLVGTAPFRVFVDSTRSFDYDGTIVGRLWSWGDGGSFSSIFATKTYSVPGVYFLNLRVTDNDGNFPNRTQMITVNPSYANSVPKRTLRNGEDPNEENKMYLASACGQGSGEACYYLGKIYEEEGNAFVAGELKARSCNLGYQQACSFR